MADGIVEEIVRKRLELHDWRYGFVLDGFLRTTSQAMYLFENWNLGRAIYLDLPDRVVCERVMPRAKVGEGSGFTKCADDDLEALDHRLAEYHENTRPLLQVFKNRHVSLSGNARQPIPEVYWAIVRGLELDGQSGLGATDSECTWYGLPSATKWCCPAICGRQAVNPGVWSS